MTEPDDTGLFGKLPRSRPGTRSPRRRTEAGAQDGAPSKAKAKATPKVVASAARPEAKPRAAARPQGPKPPPALGAKPRETEAPTAEDEDRGAGLEELAWAGIAVTAEAATLGVRLMSRALDAARRATERS